VVVINFVLVLMTANRRVREEMNLWPPNQYLKTCSSKS